MLIIHKNPTMEGKGKFKEILLMHAYFNIATAEHLLYSEFGCKIYDTQ